MLQTSVDVCFAPIGGIARAKYCFIARLFSSTDLHQVFTMQSAISSDPQVRPVFLRVSRWMVPVALLALALPWALVMWMAARPMPAPAMPNVGEAVNSPVAISARVAPTTSVTRSEVWGQLEILPLILELPEEYVFIPSQVPPVQWRFPGFSKEQAIAFLQSSGLTSRQMHTIRNAKWSIAGVATSVEPGDALILDLSPSARAATYSHLTRFGENQRHIDPFWFRNEYVDGWMQSSGLSAETQTLFRKLSYPGQPGILLFADVEPAVRQIADPNEQRRLIKALNRRETMLARIKITAATDVAAITNYWAPPGHQKDLLPLLEALKNNVIRDKKSEEKLNVVYLLPTFARERLYKYPFAASSGDSVKEDCFWSAMNFLNAVPDNRFNDLAYTAQVVKSEYYSIREAGQLGDLILLSNSRDEVVHAANYVAADLIFTKNGVAHTQPWTLMRMEDLLNHYRLQTPDLQVKCFRRKNG